MKYKHRFKKQFGQNFLQRDRFALELIKAADLPEHAHVVEIGPGDGRVTNLLLAAGHKVTAIEVDYDLIVTLVQRFNHYDEQFELIHKDVLELLTNKGADGWAATTGTKDYYVLGSLPYNISKPIISNVIKSENPPVKAAFIIQDEVAISYAANPPKATFLSMSSQLYTDVKKYLSIPASQFHPKPAVNGGIIAFTSKEVPENVGEIETLMRIGFKTPRKTLRNNLQSVYNKDDLDAAFTELELSPTIRSQELELDDWFKLYSYLDGKK